MFWLRTRVLSKIILAVICLFLPKPLTGPVLNFLGWPVSVKARIGLSLIWVDNLRLGDQASIGSFNIITAKRLVMKDGSIIRHFNIIRGPLSLWLMKGAVIGRRNEIGRAPHGVSIGTAMLRLGANAIITAGHKIDCTASVKLGDHAILAGAGSQLWTHGYVHEQAPFRYRVDGAISIGNNVYIGSRVIITGGVKISEGIIVGAGTTVARNLIELGMYVAAPLRLLPRPDDPDCRVDLERVTGPELIDTVYKKRDALP